MDGSDFLAVHPDPVVHYVKESDSDSVGVRRVNAAFEETFGTDGSNVTLSDTISAGETIEMIAGAIKNDERLDHEIECETDTGTRIFRLRNVPDGSKDGGYLVYTDITSHAKRVSELETRNERLETFASVVSHDLRNPIEIAETYLENARRSGSSEDFERVEGALDRMKELINDVLNLVREGKAIDDTERVSLARIVKEAWTTVDTADATLVLEEEDATLQTDPDRLRQLFENLFRNAVEHGGPNVTITVDQLTQDPASTATDPQSDDKTKNGFYVSDDGPGIPEKDREDVLQSGFSTSKDGTGLGLAIVKRIVDAHDWSITVTESNDGGAQFEITEIDSLQPF